MKVNMGSPVDHSRFSKPYYGPFLHVVFPKQSSSPQPSHTITPVCHSTPTDVKSPQASVAAAIDSFCSNTQVTVGKTISNERPYVDFPYSIAGSSNLVQLIISFGANGCGAWFKIDGPTCKTMLTTVLNTCSGYRGNVTDVCVVYSIDITDAKAVDPSIPDYAIHVFVCQYVSVVTFSFA
jgi:hypothetical protein